MIEYRKKVAIDFLGLWEQLNNANFKPSEFEGFKNELGGNAFTLSPQKWIKATDAIGIVSKSGRYGDGTFVNKDIALFDGQREESMIIEGDRENGRE